MKDQAISEASAQGQIGPGKLVLVVGPSGAGKDTLIGFAEKESEGNPKIVFPIRTVTRAPSEYENNRGVTPEAFEREAAAGQFALWWQAHGHSYGISRTIDADLRLGRSVIVNVSRTVVAEAKARYQNVKVVSVTAPADILAARLSARKRGSDGSLTQRLDRAGSDAGIEPDLVIENIGTAEAGAGTLLAFIRM